MAKITDFQRVLADLDRQIADLQRSREILVASQSAHAAARPKRVRKPKPDASTLPLTE